MNPLLSSLAGIFDSGPKTVPLEIFLLLLLMGLLIFMWDFFERQSSKIQQASGLEDKTEIISLRGSSYLPSKEYYAPDLGLSSRPDALIKEGDAIIPVDIKPLASKVKDRHVVALLVHLKVIEEVEGVRPPYGILLMGEKKRLVKIKNTEEKRLWLEAILAEMRSIMEGVPAVPAPAPFKCRHCDVHEICAHSAYVPKTS